MNAVQRPTLEYASTPKLADHLRLVLILRHIAMIFALTFFGGCVIGLVAAGETSQGGALPTPILVLPNLLLGSIGFFISGRLAPKGNRWPHLAWVSLGVWLAGLINVGVFGLPLAQWLGSPIIVAAMMALGGATSTLRDRSSE